MSPARSHVTSALAWATLLAAVAAALVGACSIQPQPLPPGSQTSADAGRAVSEPAPPNGTPGGSDTGAGAGGFSDAAANDGDSATAPIAEGGADGGDGGSDAADAGADSGAMDGAGGG